MKKREVTFKGKLSLEKTVEYLEALIKTLKDKKLVVQTEDSFITLTPSDSIELEVEASQKKDKNKEKLSIELSWKLGNKEVYSNDLKISSEEPEIIEEDIEDIEEDDDSI